MILTAGTRCDDLDDAAAELEDRIKGRFRIGLVVEGLVVGDLGRHLGVDRIDPDANGGILGVDGRQETICEVFRHSGILSIMATARQVRQRVRGQRKNPVSRCTTGQSRGP